MGDIGIFIAKAVLTAILTCVVGERIALYWHLRQKRRELALQTAEKFWGAYGRFFVIWKFWNYACTIDGRGLAEKREEALRQVFEAERAMEAILLQLVCERELKSFEVEAVGKFRRGYEQLRLHIRDGVMLDWATADDGKYVAVERSAAAVSYFISTIDRARSPSPIAAQQNIIDVTSSRWEKVWMEPLSEAPRRVRRP